MIKARALGAQAVCAGRPTLYGASAGGEPGAMRALDILADELHRNMQLCGTRTIAEIGRDIVAYLTISSSSTSKTSVAPA